MTYETLGKIFLGIGILCVAIFGYEFIFNSTQLTTGRIDDDIWGHFGDIVGGFVGTIVSLIGVFLLFETLREQRNSFSKQQVETRFFELLKLHRDNVAEMNSKGKMGRSVFVEIKDEFHELYNELESIYRLNFPNVNDSEMRRKLIQISYLIVFFGVNNSSTAYLKDKIQSIIGNDKIYSKIESDWIEKLIKEHRKTKEENKAISKERKSYLKFDGHQVRLGHYYRHLFQTVKYINEQPTQLFSYKEKYEYIKTLRAQLGTHEQALFLYNSISPLGEPWELLPLTAKNDKLITKYNLIKNIPFGFTREINPKDFFPHVQFEFDDKITCERKNLINTYT